MKNKILAIVLCLTMVLTSGSFAFAAEEPASQATEPAVTAEQSDEMAEEAAAEPAAIAEDDQESMIGKTVWVKKGSILYKNYKHTNKNTYETSYDHKVKIKDEFEADGVKWYKIQVADWAFALLAQYNYVKAESTTEKEPTTPSVPEEDNSTTVGDTTIEVEGNIPEGVSLTASVVKEEAYNENIEEYVGSVDSLLGVFDIKLKSLDDSVWQPVDGDKVAVTLDAESLGLNDEDRIGIIHENAEGELEDLGEVEIRDGKFTFETESFSNFYFYLTFKFGDFEYTMSGGTEMYLSELLSGLNLNRTVNNVTNVTFSNPEVLEVSKVDADWLLKSIEPFGDDEVLTITFNDGKVIEIGVKDPVVKNYVVDSDITNIEKLATTSYKVGTVSNGDKASQNKTYKMNTAVITKADICSAGTEAVPTATQMVIYVEEGMALRFEPGTVWDEAEGARPTKGSNGVWFWSWDSNYNYAVIEEGSAGKQHAFQLNAPNSSGTTEYCNVIIAVVERSKPELLETALASSGLEGYSIADIPVTLYNYDGKAFNQYYDNMGSNYFSFSGTSKGVASIGSFLSNRTWTSSGLQANGGGSVALMGIVKDRLVNGLPEMSVGQAVDVFSSNTVPGKTIYEDVDFQFVYNENTGYYIYNGALNHAQYDGSDPTDKKIRLYKQSLAGSDTPNGDSHGNAGFYPFEDINKAFTNTGHTDLTWTEWAEKLNSDTFMLTPSEYSTDISLTSATSPASTVDLHYGVQIGSDFYLPESKQMFGKDMVYEFTGDDDLWVFIDGKLVLDIGGGHTYVSGSINLNSGEVWVEKYTKLAAADGGSYATREQGTDLRYTDEFLKNLTGDQMHTIQVFYLERHAGVSNCKMKFNLPLVPSGSVNVSKNLKTLVDVDGDAVAEELSIIPDEEYTFKLYTAEDDDDNVDATNFEVLKDAEYKVMGVGAPTETQKTDASTGEFKLREGWIATFENIDRFTEVYAEEIKPNGGYVYGNTLLTVNKDTENAVNYVFSESEGFNSANNAITRVMQKDSNINFDFVNYMESAPLTIEKEVVGGTEGLFKDLNGKDKTYNFNFDLVFTQDVLEDDAIETTGDLSSIKVTNKNSGDDVNLGGSFQLQHGQSVTIPKVPVNMTYTVQETGLDSSFDTPEYTLTRSTATEKTNEYKIVAGGENKIKVINQQRFNLTISKTGIQEVDHDGPNALDPGEEEQTTIFEVRGKGHNESFVTKVAICGNNSVTIKGLPVGEYTVKEITDWSWRYDVKPGTAVERTVIPNEVDETEAYINERTNQYWLNGGAYVQNVFN